MSLEGAGPATREPFGAPPNGYPGALTVQVTYTLTHGDPLVIDYHATSDAPTPVTLTQHSYFNLAGAGAGDILDHELWLNARAFTPLQRAGPVLRD